MADSSVLDDNLAQAAHVFELAEHFSKLLDEDWQSIKAAKEYEELQFKFLEDKDAEEIAEKVDADQIPSGHSAPWSRHKQNFTDLSNTLDTLIRGVDKVRKGFVLVEHWLSELQDILTRISQSTRHKNQRTSASDMYQAALEAYPEINSVVLWGKDAIKSAIEENFKEPGPEPTTPFTLLDKFPATPTGHIAFLELVLSEVHNLAEAKQKQLAREYTNDTLASMVGGIKWVEAKKRIAKLAELTELPAAAVAEVAPVLQRELTDCTVEQIDKLLTPAVLALRDAWENRVQGDCSVEVSIEQNPKTALSQKGGVCRGANLAHWGIGLDEKSEWQLFHRKNNDSKWRLRGLADIKQGLMHDVLKLFADNGGSAQKSDLVATLKIPGKTDHEIMEKRVSPTLSKLRRAIKNTIKRAGKIDDVNNPLPPPVEISDTWIAAITIGYAVLPDTLPIPEGMKLTLSKKLTLITKEKLKEVESLKSAARLTGSKDELGDDLTWE